MKRRILALLCSVFLLTQPVQANSCTSCFGNFVDFMGKPYTFIIVEELLGISIALFTIFWAVDWSGRGHMSEESAGNFQEASGITSGILGFMSFNYGIFFFWYYTLRNHEGQPTQERSDV